MTTTYDQQALLAEFEALKAKFGEAASDLKVVRFRSKKTEHVAASNDFVPYWCRTDDEGFTECEDERPI